GRDGLRIPVLDELRVCANHPTGHPCTGGKNHSNGACGKEAADLSVARMLEGSRYQGRPRQGAQEIHVRMQEDRKGCRCQDKVIVAACNYLAHHPSPALVSGEPGGGLERMIR